MINFKICHVGRRVPPVFVDSTGIVTNGLVAQFDGKHSIKTGQDKNSTTWYALAGKMILQLKITKTQSCSFYQRDWVFSACWYQYLSFYLMTHFRLSNRFYQARCCLYYWIWYDKSVDISLPVEVAFRTFIVPSQEKNTKKNKNFCRRMRRQKWV